MFASWSRTRSAVVAGVATAALVLVANPEAQALEGIQSSHAIFYPSLELVYQHDDNFFLSEFNEVSADSFLARANFALEIPGARHNLRLEYSPQYRNVNVNQGSFDLQDSTSHFFDLQAHLHGSSVFSVDIANSYALGSLEVDSIDPNRGELLNRAGSRFWSNRLNVDFNWEGSTQGATISVGRFDSNWDDLATSAPSWFELNETTFGAEYAYKFTPLSRFVVGISFADTSQTPTGALRSTAGIPNGVDPNSNRLGVHFGFAGELGRTTTGSAKIGFASLDYDQNAGNNADWDGVTLDAAITKAFSRYSKLAFSANRNVNFSGFATDVGGSPVWNTYYVSNRGAVTFTQQPQGGRVFWSLKGAFQRNTYDQLAPTGRGGFSEREDDITSLRAELGYHPLEHLSLRFNYRYEERESNLVGFGYTDNLIIFQAQLGF
ncbi:MAG: outer membrane beta-barrel protein [Acidobacteriota bacterium]